MTSMLSRLPIAIAMAALSFGGALMVEKFAHLGEFALGWWLCLTYLYLIKGE